MRIRSTTTAAACAMLALSGLALAGCAGEAPAPHAIGIRALDAGACFDATADGATALRMPDCTWAHDHEALSVEAVDLASYPGEDAMRTRANETCTAAFAAYVGRIPADAPELIPEFFAPSEASWAEGDEVIVCSARTADGSRRQASVRAAA